MAPERLNQLAQTLPRRLKPRARSLLVTVWGDAIAPHGAAICNECISLCQRSLAMTTGSSGEVAPDQLTLGGGTSPLAQR